MKISRRKKALQAARLISNGTFVDVKKASKVLDKVARGPKAGKNVKVRVFKNGVVMRFTNENETSRVARSLEKAKRSVEDPWIAAYTNAVGQLYVADKVDIEKVAATAGKDVSEKVRAFYSRFAPAAK